MPLGQLGLYQAPMANVTALLPPLLFPSLPLPPSCIPSFCLCLGGRSDFGEPVPRCSLEHRSLLSIMLLWCLLPSLCPTCSPRELAHCLAPCPLLTDSLHLQNSFSPSDTNFFPLFLFSLCLPHVLLSPQPYCSRKVSAFSPFLWLLWLSFCPLWSDPPHVCVCCVVDNSRSWCLCLA